MNSQEHYQLCSGYEGSLPISFPLKISVPPKIFNEVTSENNYQEDSDMQRGNERMFFGN